jgi:hypothetical protein
MFEFAVFEELVKITKDKKLQKTTNISNFNTKNQRKSAPGEGFGLRGSTRGDKLIKREVMSGFSVRIGAYPDTYDTLEINFLLCYGC